MRIFFWLVLLAFGLIMAFATTSLPHRGDVDAPTNTDFSVSGSRVASNYYIRNALNDAKTPNIVTTVLGDYRGFDTLGEVIVVLAAGLCCSLILARRKP